MDDSSSNAPRRYADALNRLDSAKRTYLGQRSPESAQKYLAAYDEFCAAAIHYRGQPCLADPLGTGTE